jgi:thiol:disulfide interchange protein DsbA
VAGRDYKETSTPKRLYPDPADDVELVFVFWYACGACRAMDPVFKQYAAIHSDGVKIRTLPALYDKNEFWMMHGRLYFALEQLGKEEELHQAIFEEIQGESPSGAHSHENERLSSLPSIISFVESKGISKEDFQKAWDSPEVQANIDRGLAFIQNVGIEGVPAMAIDGRYSFSISRKGPGFFLATADFLIAKEKAAKTE